MTVVCIAAVDIGSEYWNFPLRSSTSPSPSKCHSWHAKPPKRQPLSYLEFGKSPFANVRGQEVSLTDLGLRVGDLVKGVGAYDAERYRRWES